MPNEWDDFKPSEEIAAEHHAALNPLEVGAKTVGKALKQNLIDAPIGVGQALGSMVQDPFKGNVPGASLISAIRNEIADKQARATVKGETWYPGKETISNIKEGYQQSDPDKLSSGLGDVLGLAGPEAARFIPGSKLGMAGADLARASAAKNYEKIFMPYRTGEEGAAQVPSIQRAAEGLAKSPEKIMGGEETVGRQLEAGRKKYGPLTATARDARPGLDPNPIKASIQKAMEGDVYVQDSPTPQIKNPTAKTLYDELLDRIDKATNSGQAVNQTPGVVTPGYTGKTSVQPMVSEKALDDLKDMFNARAKGKSEVMKVNPSFDVGDEAKWERVMANHLADALDHVNAPADAIESNYNLFATAKRLYQSGRNRAFLENAEGGIGLPLKMGGTGGVRLTMPSGIKNMVDGIKWNTVSATGKKAIADSLATGNWKKAMTMLQMTKLGVPITDSYREAGQ